MTFAPAPDRAASPAPAGAPRQPWPSLSPAWVAGIAAAWTAAMALLVLLGHPTPLYYVETDLLGEYLPTARELAAGVVNTAHYAFKGPGYPLLVAWLSAPLHGNLLLAARLLSVLAAGLAAWLAWVIARRAAGATVATFTLFALLASPLFVAHAIESGTDTPALALMLGATLLVLGAGGAPAAALAGLLAGVAMLTRGNALFLLPCAAVVLAWRPGSAASRLAALTAYAIGAAVPLSAWALVAARHGGLPADRNYLNVAWELYGRGVPWDRFESTIGVRFHSLRDVLAYDPLLALRRIAANLVVQRGADLRELVTLVPGVLAVPGVVLLARDRAARGWLLHGLACALVLAPVFYNPRFALYLLPLWLAAAGATLAWLAARAGTLAPATRTAVTLAALAVIVWLGVSSATQSRGKLADAPHETRLAGEALARMGFSGGRIVARKPHVAYFAKMDFVPLPATVPLSALAPWARAQGAELLFFSGIEQVMRPDDAVLADSGVSLPGFHQVAWRALAHDHFYAIYRLDAAPADSAVFAAAYRAALVRYEERRPRSAEALLYVAIQWLDLGEPAQAQSRLERLERAGARDPAVEKYLAAARLATGDLDGAAHALESAMTLSAPSADLWSQLGQVRGRQGREADAVECYRKAVAIEPASLEYLERLGVAQARGRDFATAGATFERAARLAPADVQACRYAIGAWKLAGDEARASAAFARGVRAGIPPAALECGAAR